MNKALQDLKTVSENNGSCVFIPSDQALSPSAPISPCKILNALKP